MGARDWQRTPRHARFRPVPTADEITLRGMRFHTRIGVLPHERELPQPLEVDLTVRLHRDPGAPAMLLDYRGVYDAAADAVGSAPLAFLEDVAETIAGNALGLAGVRSVRVAVRKPNVALPGPLAHAEVVLEREAAGA